MNIKQYMKKKNWKLLLIYAVIGIAVAGTTGWFLYQDRVKTLRAQARDTFGKALTEGLRKWNGIYVYYMSSGKFQLPDDSIDIKKDPIKIHMGSEFGKKDFLVPYEKHHYNIEQSSDKRGMHSYLLKVSPLNADSLGMIWKSRLDSIAFPGTTAIRISVSDWWEHESYTYSSDSLYVSQSDSLFSCYLGYRCEVGVTGYLYTSWRMLFTWEDLLLLAVLIVGCMLLSFIQEYVVKILHRLFVKEKLVVEEKTVVIEKEVPVIIEKKVPVIIEKEVPVIAGHDHHSHIYQLEEGTYFDTDLRMLKRGDVLVKLMPQLAKLLQGFLDAEDYRLSNDEIIQLLWPKNDGTADKLHQNIKRLRGCLSQISSTTIESENFTYRLKIPISSGKSLLK